ncbi:hypothetical protein [Rhodococcus sp. MEB032]|uniref:hypothetical protein n=1 Tax=Rhodococcus sp. MEB032 TaxID=3040322 RepID=UPI002549E211|nr:hypothetical protein [Rhodococcus sp. MEB032]
MGGDNLAHPATATTGGNEELAYHCNSIAPLQQHRRDLRCQLHLAGNALITAQLIINAPG